MQKKSKVEKFIVNLSAKVAAASAGEASLWYMCQPKEPEALRKYVEQNKK